MTKSFMRGGQLLEVVIARERRDLAARLVHMVVLVVIDRQALGVLLPEHLDKGRMLAHHRGMAAAADMLIEAYHAVGRGHDEMEIVGDHQHRAVIARADAGDEVVERGLPGYVHALDRLVEHQKSGSRRIARARSTRWNSPPEMDWTALSMT